MEEQERGGGKVRNLIEMATNSTEREIDPRLLKSIKFVVRYSEPELRIASATLLDVMKRHNSQIRYLTLLIIHELFMRSKLFRSLLVTNMDQLLSLSVGLRRNHPLPPPASVATILRAKAMEFLEKWNDAFGIYYRQVRLGFEYLKNTLQLQFPNIQANAARIEEKKKERELRSKEILLNKYETLNESLPSMKNDIQMTIDEIVECLDILRCKESLPFGPLDDEGIEECHSFGLRQLRLEALREGEKIHENNDNKVVFDALRELYKLLVTKHLVLVQEWISILVRVEVTDNRLRDSLLKELIDIQNRIQSLKKKCEKAGCSLSNIVDHEEEDFWEEGQIERVETNAQEKLSDVVSVASNSKSIKRKSPELRNKGAETSNSSKSKVLDEAPVSDIPESSVQTTEYEEKRIEVQPCRAPLKKGGLCPRRDLRICPFHGLVVPRDDEGRPINQISSTAEMPTDPASLTGEKPLKLGDDLVEQLTRQAVKNVRDRDKEEAKMRQNDEKSLKRAKLLKIREHNKAVLRDAAVAATSSSSAFGDETGRETTLTRNTKKKSVASMLRKKVTVKDRLTQRLLNTKGRNASVRKLTLGL